MGATDFLESLLKWASVAYALGFVTVMVNTARIGVPTIQLLDPVQIWVGIPLALVFWLIFAAAKYFGKRAELVKNEIQLHQEQYTKLVEVAKNDDVIELTHAFFQIVLDQNTGILLPITYFVGSLESFIFRRLSDQFAHLMRKEQPDSRTAEPSSTRPALTAMMPMVVALTKRLAWIKGWSDYLSNAFYVGILLLGASLFYIMAVYPLIPQSWGGGRPTVVRMSLDKERMPAEVSDFAYLFARTGDASDVSKSRLGPPLTLLYSTEHAYYIRLSSGKVMQINPEAVTAILFDSKEQESQLPQTHSNSAVRP